MEARLPDSPSDRPAADASATTALLVQDADDIARLRQWCAARGITAAHVFRADQVDDLDRSVRAGRIRQVILSDAAPLLYALLDGEADFAGWRAANVRIDVLAADQSGVGALLPAFQAASIEWNSRRRHRNAAFGAGLSVLTIALCAAYWLLLRP
jgi:hypothetical protein